MSEGIGGSRLQRAVDAFAAWDEAGRTEPATELLARHTDLRDLLAPMLEDELDDPSVTMPPSGTGTEDDGDTPRTFADGAYRVIRELGRGGMGAVFETEQVELGRRVVLKLLSSGAAAVPELRARLRREAWTAARLRHPGIVKVLDVGEQGEESYIVMEFVEGAPLDKVLAHARQDESRDGRTFVDAVLSEQLRPQGSRNDDAGESEALRESPTWQAGWNDTVLRIAASVAEALHHAHQSRVVHRDVKPSNILVRPDGSVVLVDFGVARDDALPSLTAPGQFAGTPHYTSPEQASAGGVPVDGRSDVFSLGATLFEMLTLRLPFEGESSHAVVHRILTEPPSDLRRFDPRASADLRAVVERSMARRPERRYQSAAEFAADLRALAARQPVEARPISTLERTWSWVRREPWLAGLTGALFLSLAVGAVVAAMLFVEARHQASVASQRLDDVERLADARRVAALLDEADSLWPAVPDRERDLIDWIDRAEDLASRLAIHRRTLEALRGQARTLTVDELEALRAGSAPGLDLDFHAQRDRRLRAELLEMRSEFEGAEGSWQEIGESLISKAEAALEKGNEESADAQARIEKLEWWRFASDELQWQHDLLAQLIRDLETRLTDPETGALEDVRLRLAAARDLATIRDEAHAAAWREALRQIADRSACPHYDGLQLEPLVGLVPIGRDPLSGFHEFADQRTGEIPVRDADGKLLIDGDTALVLTLLPGTESATLGATPQEEVGSRYRRFDPLARGNEHPIRRITLSPFLIGKYEVSRGQWRTLLDRSFLPAAWHLDKIDPVGFLSHDTAQHFCKRLGCVLPTEAQWEYAARGGTDTPWWTGAEYSSLNGAANLCDRSVSEVDQRRVKHPEFDDGYANYSPVGSYPPNAFGLHDMTGNVWEWCADVAVPDLFDPVREHDGMLLSRRGDRRALRGGGFGSDAAELRSAFRTGDFPGNEAPDTGFRVVRSLPGRTDSER